MVWLWFPVVLAVVASLVTVAVLLVLPAVSEASERVRVQREAQEASWRIHQHATDAFAQMLDAARRTGPGEEP